MRYPTSLTIAGSDSGGCAGIQADLKTFSALGVFGTSAITSITAQNTREVRAIKILSPEIITQQLETILDDITVDVVKTGMLPSVEIIERVASVIDQYHLSTFIVDPVMVATSGVRLTSSSIADAFKYFLYSRLTLITPNIPETEVLANIKIHSEKDIYKAAHILLSQGCPAVLIKGGHSKSTHSTDTLFRTDKEPISYTSPRINSQNLHGTGCTFSSAIAAYMALGNDLENAIKSAKNYISSAIYKGMDIKTGQGSGPVNHSYDPKPLKSRKI